MSPKNLSREGSPDAETTAGRAGDLVGVIVPAGGGGKRMGPGKKQFRTLGEVQVLERTLAVFEHHPEIDRIYVAVPEEDREALAAHLGRRESTKVAAVVGGGKTRQASVAAALACVPDEIDFVLVHDAVRPFVSAGEIHDVLEAARHIGAAALAIPVTDTVRRGEDTFGETISRENLWRMQTPQAFRTKLLKSAHQAAADVSQVATDEVALVQAAGHPVEIVLGSEQNFKLTSPGDWELAQLIARDKWEERPMTARIGFGYDVHRLVEGRPLIIGGVNIPFDRGLEGHSDADVLLHAVADALLGAAAMGDIGQHFPDNDPKWKDADSAKLLSLVAERVREAGFVPCNVDATLVLQRPKLRPYVDQMERNTARCLNLDTGAVSVKATTTEKLGFEGREEGIAAHAVVLVEARPGSPTT